VSLVLFGIFFECAPPFLPILKETSSALAPFAAPTGGLNPGGAYAIAYFSAGNVRGHWSGQSSRRVRRFESEIPGPSTEFTFLIWFRIEKAKQPKRLALCSEGRERPQQRRHAHSVIFALGTGYHAPGGLEKTYPWIHAKRGESSAGRWLVNIYGRGRNVRATFTESRCAYSASEDEWSAIRSARPGAKLRLM
jgi:hypothetical protein